MAILDIRYINYPTPGNHAPMLLYIGTNDTLATVTTPGYLNAAIPTYGNIFSQYQMAMAYTSDNLTVLFSISISGATITLVPVSSSGSVTSVTGTPNQIIASPTTGAVVLSLPNLWFTVNSPTTMVSVYSYIVNSASVAFTLPLTANVGDVMEIAGYNNLWSVAQNAGQQIQFGIQNTTLGTGGSLNSTLMGDCIRLVCTVANTNWLVLSETGNVTFV